MKKQPSTEIVKGLSDEQKAVIWAYFGELGSKRSVARQTGHSEAVVRSVLNEDPARARTIVADRAEERASSYRMLENESLRSMKKLLQLVENKIDEDGDAITLGDLAKMGNTLKGIIDRTGQGADRLEQTGMTIDPGNMSVDGSLITDEELIEFFKRSHFKLAPAVRDKLRNLLEDGEVIEAEYTERPEPEQGRAGDAPPSVHGGAEAGDPEA